MHIRLIHSAGRKGKGSFPPIKLSALTQDKVIKIKKLLFQNEILYPSS
jgi:hypothetical protein